MQRKHMHFPDNIWQRLMALSQKEGVAVADVLRRLLADAMGLNEESLASVQLEADAGDPLPRIRRDLLGEKIARSKLANTVARLRLDLDDFAAADPTRQAAWEGLQGAFEQLSTDMQTHVDRAERLFTQTSQAIAGLYQGLVDVRGECESLRAGITALHNSLRQGGLLDIDVLRRLSALETGVADDQSVEAMKRGDQWLSRVGSRRFSTPEQRHRRKGNT